MPTAFTENLNKKISLEMLLIIEVDSDDMYRFSLTMKNTEDSVYFPFINVTSVLNHYEKTLRSNLGNLPKKDLIFPEAFYTFATYMEENGFFKKIIYAGNNAFFHLKNTELATVLRFIEKKIIIPLYFYTNTSDFSEEIKKPNNNNLMSLKSGLPPYIIIADIPKETKLASDGLVELKVETLNAEVPIYAGFTVESESLLIFPETVQQLLSSMLFLRSGIANPDKAALVQLVFLSNFLEEGVIFDLPLKMSDELQATISHQALSVELVATKDFQAMVLEMFFIYGDTRIEALSRRQNTDEIIAPQEEKEKKFINLLHRFTKIDIDRPVYKTNTIILEEMEDIFTFIEDAIPEFTKRGATVLLDDALKRMSSQEMNIGINVSWLPEGLIEYNLEKNDTTSLEELSYIMKQYKLKRRFITLKDGTVLDTERATVKDELKSLSAISDHLEDFNENNSITLPSYTVFDMTLAEKEAKEQIKLDNDIQDMVHELKNPTPTPLNLHPDLRAILRPYQLIGVYWLQLLAKYHLGGILADEMGLGKTLQVIAFLTTCTWEDPVLIVAPKTLIYNWKSEFERFAPHLKIKLVDGTPQQREETLKHAEPNDILITSYPLITKDFKLYPEQFSYVFIDEAQYVKNHKTKAAHAITQISSRYRFALSGTPFENNLMELWSIFNFLMPGFFPPEREFKKNTLTPIQRDNNEETLEHLKEKISPLILRRLKKDVLLELPDKIISPLYCEMEPEQAQIYEFYLRQAQSEVRTELSVHGFQKSRMKILAVLTRLRQACTHPSMFIENYDGGSGKMNALEEILSDALLNGNKVLIFSQFKTMLDIIAANLDKKKLPYYYLHGSTKGPDRFEMVNAFNEPENTTDIFLLSLKAGGTGLNLTAADIVVHFDPWWNPSVENQATDRAHRFGQTNVVQVFQFITTNSIEEKIQIIKSRKQQLFDALFTSEAQAIELFSEEDIKVLLDIEDENEDTDDIIDVIKNEA